MACRRSGVRAPVAPPSPRDGDLNNSFVNDWSAIDDARYEAAQSEEREFWSRKDSELLRLRAGYYFYAGYHAWSRDRHLLNPFRVSLNRPQNYQIDSGEMDGAQVLEIGCGPSPASLSLVHAARVTVIDPLADFFRDLQPFGWDEFERVIPAVAEQIDCPASSFDFVVSENVLDHVQDADAVLAEVVRVLRPGGSLLLRCHVRADVTEGGPAHPYRWALDELASGVLARFEPVRPPLTLDLQGSVVPEEMARLGHYQWTARLRPRAGP